jgi:pyruvate kinase
VRRTKVVCTVGPATSSRKVVRLLVPYVDVFRLNFSHGDYASHLGYLSTIRQEAKRSGRTVAILQDLPGPKIRVGKLVNGGHVEVTLSEDGEKLKLETRGANEPLLLSNET